MAVVGVVYVVSSCVGLDTVNQNLPAGVYNGNFVSAYTGAANPLTESAIFNFSSESNVIITNYATSVTNLTGGVLTNPVNQNNICFTGSMQAPMAGGNLQFKNCKMNTTGSTAVSFTANYYVYSSTNSNNVLDSGIISFTKY